MTGEKWVAGEIAFRDRMPPLAAETLNEAHTPPAPDGSVGALSPFPF